MAKLIDYYFTPISPWMYFGHERFVALAKRHAATINVKPVDLGRVFAVSGGLPLKQRAPQRVAYREVEMRRWSELLSIPLNPWPKFFPVSGDLAAKWILAALDHGEAAALALMGAIGRAVWTEERNVADAETLATIANACGLDAGTLGARAAADEFAQRYDALTQEAIDRKVFGSPWYVYRGEPFWGQDRLDFLDRALAK
jgi:2-hydroxychromene-2-carboxylate isomerase